MVQKSLNLVFTQIRMGSVSNPWKNSYLERRFVSMVIEVLFWWSICMAWKNNQNVSQKMTFFLKYIFGAGSTIAYVDGFYD